MKTIVITGASTGIGHATVEACLQQGHQVIATARRASDLECLERLGANAIHLDLHHHDSVLKAAEQIRTASQGHIDVIFNNAGYGLQVAMEDTTWEALEKQFSCNVIGPVIFTNTLLDCLTKGSQIIFNSSILGIVSPPLRGPYCMSKHALEAASDAYQLELESQGIAVHAVQPGPIIANFRGNALQALRACLQGKSTRLDYTRHIARLDASEPTPGSLPASAVAEVVLDIIEGRKHKPRYLITRTAKMAAFAKRILGYRFHYIARRAEPITEQQKNLPPK